jgi:hypothetical protein
MVSDRIRLKAAASGNLEAMLAEELNLAQNAVSSGMTELARDFKEELAADVVRGGLGRKVSRSWRANTYPEHTVSMSAAAVVHTKAPKLVDAFDHGREIRSKNKKWIAVPTMWAPKRGVGRKRISPSNFPEARYGPLKFIYRDKGPSLLVVEDQRTVKSKRGGFALSRNKRALKSKKSLSIVPMFYLFKKTRLKKRLNVASISEKYNRRLGRYIDEGFKRQDAKRRYK